MTVKHIGIIGVAFGTNRSFIQSLSKGMFETYNLSIKTLQFIGKMLTGNMGTDNLSGPIGIALIASIPNNVSWPPLRTGIGSKFNTPKLILSKAIKYIKGMNPA